MALHYSYICIRVCLFLFVRLLGAIFGCVTPLCVTGVPTVLSRRRHAFCQLFTAIPSLTMLRGFSRVFAPILAPIAIRYCPLASKQVSYNRIGSALLLHLRFFSSIPEETTLGDYAIILPPDPPVWGTSHIIPRTVPEHILRPPYASATETDSEDPFLGDPYEGDGRICLRSEAETSLRAAATLARNTLQWIGPQVQVQSTVLSLASLFYSLE